MQSIFKTVGVEVFNLSVDYRLADGTDAHRSVQTVGGNRDIVVKEVLRFCQQHGERVAAIIHYPGDYSPQDIEAICDGLRPGTKYEFLYLNPC